jgi:hypothetical protein
MAQHPAARPGAGMERSVRAHRVPARPGRAGALAAQHLPPPDPGGPDPVRAGRADLPDQHSRQRDRPGRRPAVLHRLAPASGYPGGARRRARRLACGTDRSPAACCIDRSPQPAALAGPGRGGWGPDQGRSQLWLLALAAPSLALAGTVVPRSVVASPLLAIVLWSHRAGAQTGETASIGLRGRRGWGQAGRLPVKTSGRQECGKLSLALSERLVSVVESLSAGITAVRDLS